MRGIAQLCDEVVEIFPIRSGEGMVQGLLGEDFKAFGPPLLVARREVLGANAVISPS